MPSCTNNLDVELQIWPLVQNTPNCSMAQVSLQCLCDQQASICYAACGAVQYMGDMQTAACQHVSSIVLHEAQCIIADCTNPARLGRTDTHAMIGPRAGGFPKVQHTCTMLILRHHAKCCICVCCRSVSRHVKLQAQI